MKQEEKNQLSKVRIINAAIAEFGVNSFENASLNNLCSDHNISKGLIYHYFKNKDELYLCCVQICFNKLTAFLDDMDYKFTDFLTGMKEYFSERQRFFQENPDLSKIFFHAILQPPSHLEIQIKELKKDFDVQGMQYYEMALSQVELRDDVSFDDAMELFIILQEIFNNYLGRKIDENADTNILMSVHERKLSKFINMMLYGVAKEKINL